MSLLIECLDAEQNDQVTNFIRFTYDRLGITDNPVISFEPHLGTTSFGLYNPSSDTIDVAVAGRHISDVLRTLAHELVHHVQMNLGDIEIKQLGELEYEANAVAGMLMRDYNKLHPEMFGLAADVPAPQDTIGDSLGAASPDVTRPSGPIEMAETAINAVGSGAYASLGVGPQGEPGIDFEVDIDSEGNDPDWNHTHDHINSLHRHHTHSHHARQRIDTHSRNLDIKKWKDEEEARHLPSVQNLTELSNQTLASYKRKAKRHLRFRKREGHPYSVHGYYGIEFSHNPNLGPKREHGIKTAEEKLKARYAHLKEDGAVVNSAGSGAIAGIGVGSQGEPGVHPKKKKSPILAPMVRRKTLGSLGLPNTSLKSILKGKKTFKQLKEELS